MFTPNKQRAQRLSDAIAVKGSGDDAWAMIDDSALNSVAANARTISPRISPIPPRPRPQALPLATPSRLFLVDIRAGYGRCDIFVMLFARPRAAMTRRVRARAPARAVGESTVSGTMKILAGNSNRPLAEAIAAYLGVPLTGCHVRRFADLEIFVEILENVRGRDTFIIQSTSYPANDNLMELLIMIDALRRASAQRITAVIPYFGYARQDRKPGPRSPISAKLVANLITRAGADRVLTVDLHAGQIQGFFDIPTDNLFGAPTMVRDIQAHHNGSKNVMVVSPDVGGVVRARALAKRLDAPLAIVDKRRERAGEFGSDERHRRHRRARLRIARRHRRFGRHALQRRGRPARGRRGERIGLYHPRRSIGRRGRRVAASSSANSC